MKLSDLKRKTVVGLAGGHKLGTVADVLTDSSYRQVQALRVKPTEGGPDYVVSTDHVQAIGSDVVTVDDRDSLARVDQVPELTRLPSLNSLLGDHVVTERGDVLGTISEVDVDPSSRRIVALQYTSSALAGLLGRQHALEPQDVIGIGPSIVTVKETARPSKAA